jgi:hypothetical protein
MKSLRPLLLACALAMPLVAHGANPPVTYNVDDTALKAATIGTNLSFQLYTDPACTNAAGAPIVVLIRT